MKNEHADDSMKHAHLQTHTLAHLPCIWTRNSVLIRLADSDSFSLLEEQRESTSSMKIMLGLCCLANSNRFFTSLCYQSINQSINLESEPTSSMNMLGLCCLANSNRFSTSLHIHISL